MNFDLDDTQQEIRSLAADVLGRLATTSRLEAVEATPDRFDRDLWAELGRTGLLGVAVADEYDGLGLGMVELALVCEQLGRAVAPVPLVATACAALAIAEHGDDGQRREWLPRVAAGGAVLAVAPTASVVRMTVEGTTLTGELVGVPWAHVADGVVVPVDGSLWLLDPRARGGAAPPRGAPARGGGV